MKVLIFGGRGYLGQEFLKLYPDALTPSLDIAEASQVAAALDDLQPELVINAAGKTGRPNVDWCEDHKLETVRANITGPLVLLQECAKRSLYWIHLSSGCIYQGDGSTSLTAGNGGRGFSEDDPPNFFGSFYARSKAWSDQILKEFPVLVLRLRMPFDGSHHDRNLISKLIRYERVLDVQNSLTYMPDFLEAARVLIERRRIGIFNIVNPGTISPFEIMKLYKKFVQKDHSFQPLSLQELPEVARAGRSNCMLSTLKLAKERIQLRPIEQAVHAALQTFASQP